MPEVRQPSRLRRLRNLSVLLVVAAIVVCYFTVIRRPTSPSRSASTASGTPTAEVLANTNADVVSIRQSDYHPGFTLPVGSPVLEEHGDTWKRQSLRNRSRRFKWDSGVGGERSPVHRRK